MKNVGNKSILDQVKEWEGTFRALYNRKPRMIEREQYFIGRLHGMQSLAALDAAISAQPHASNGGEADPMPSSPPA